MDPETTEEVVPEEKPESRLKKILKIIFFTLLHLIFIAYFILCTVVYIFYDKSSSKCKDKSEFNASGDVPTNQTANVTAHVFQPHILCSINWCVGFGFLIIMFCLIYILWFYYKILKRYAGQKIYDTAIEPISNQWMGFSRRKIVSILMLVLLLAVVAIFVVVETYNQPNKLISLVAPCFFILTGYVFSTKRSAIQWRIVITGITCQFLLGFLCLRWDFGRKVFECLGHKIEKFLNFTSHGSRFAFGNQLIDQHVFAFSILPVIFFFSFFISILYYLGAMQWIVLTLGWILQQLLGTTICESLIAAANVFLGMSESPLLIRPYLNRLTKSEIHTIMVSGFATVSGTVLAAYISFGANPAHLVTSSVMAAPAALALAKLYMPETEESQTSSDTIQLEKSTDSSLLDAAANGATLAIPIVLGIIANIVAFVAFLAFLNGIVSWMGMLVGLDDINFEWIFSKLFIPLVWAMGVPWQDCNIIAKVVATKSIINEFVAYQRLGVYIEAGQITARSAGIATFAICGFANPSSLGILIGSLSVMAPLRRADITAVAFRAVLVGSIVCFMSASFAGLFLRDSETSRAYKQFFNNKEPKDMEMVQDQLRYFQIF